MSKDVSSNGLRELNLREIEFVSGGGGHDIGDTLVWERERIAAAGAVVGAVGAAIDAGIITAPAGLPVTFFGAAVGAVGLLTILVGEGVNVFTGSGVLEYSPPESTSGQPVPLPQDYPDFGNASIQRGDYTQIYGTPWDW